MNRNTQGNSKFVKPQTGKTIVRHTANGPVVVKVQPPSKPNVVKALVNWLKG